MGWWEGGGGGAMVDSSQIMRDMFHFDA